MHMLWPEFDTAELTDAQLAEIYGYPANLTRPWVQVNFVSSVDGAVTVAGRSTGLSSPADKRIYNLGRDLADVILVGERTVLVEEYHGFMPTEVRAHRRAQSGLSPVPPIAVVSESCSLNPDSPFFTDTSTPPIVLTGESAPQERQDALAAAGAHIVLVTETNGQIELVSALAELGRRGLNRVCCEGGPTLFGHLIEENLVDRLFLTISPLLLAGTAGRIATSSHPATPHNLQLTSVLRDENFLMLSYQRGERINS